MSIAAAMAAGCGKPRAAAPREAVLRYPLAGDLTTMDPALANGEVPCELLQNVFEGLVALDSQNRVVPALAERWEVSRDGTVYTFHLRRNARFHAPYARTITAEDVKYSFERALWPETKSPTALSYLGPIAGAQAVAKGSRRDLAGVRVIDSSTLALRLDMPRACFLSMLAYAPAWVVCREAIERSGGRLDEKAAIGSGPFRFATYRRGVKLILAANADYYGGRPPLDRIERIVVPDRQTAHLMYERGDIDLCDVAASDYRRDLNDPNLRSQLRLTPLASITFLVMHPHLEPAFRDVRVRRAFAQAIDRDAIVRIAFQNASSRADGILPPGLPGSNGVAALPYDPSHARGLLESAGYPNGRGFPNLTLVTMHGSTEAGAIAHLIRDDLRRNLDITVDLQQREPASFIHDYYAEKIPFYIAGWAADYPDAQDFLSTLFRSGAPLNHYGYSDPRFDSLCDSADAEPQTEKRLALYRRAEQIAIDEVAMLPLVCGKRRLLVKPYVLGLSSNLVNLLPHKSTRIVH